MGVMMTNRRYPRYYSDGGDTLPPSTPYVPEPSADTDLKRGGRRHRATGGSMCRGGRRHYDDGGTAQSAPSSNGSDIWGTLGHIAEIAAPFLPMLLALKKGGEVRQSKRLRRAVGGAGKTRKNYPYT
jgi:hypothetical protein